MLRDCKDVEHDKQKAYNTQRIDMLLRKETIKRCNAIVCKVNSEALSKPMRAEFVLQKLIYQPSTLISTSILFPILCVNTLLQVGGGSYGKH